jgi:hypothetical protein
MRDTRLYSSAFYESQLADYENQMAHEENTEQRERLSRWIHTTKEYLAEAKKAGL